MGLFSFGFFYRLHRNLWSLEDPNFRSIKTNHQCTWCRKAACSAGSCCPTSKPDSEHHSPARPKWGSLSPNTNSAAQREHSWSPSPLLVDRYVLSGGKNFLYLGVDRYKWTFFLCARSGAGPDGRVSVWATPDLFTAKPLLSKLAMSSSLPVSALSSQPGGDADTELARLPEPIYLSCSSFSKIRCVWRPWSCQSSKKPCSQG